MQQNNTNKKLNQKDQAPKREHQKDSGYTGDKKLGGPNRPAE
ncbi:MULTISPECIES: hypothetical protein [Alkalihalophilus]|uniref:Uncharacterized protein n=2 Tax=Alkalihalophilus pseudofirmus TaxID=79885 RepID=D3G0M7_ALKPO|nr:MULTISPECIES: hypothetical protein [Alkalihalophilus]ADC51189.1 hypothetical protein BpOF4_15700 [Alkalihalophilus pseudofirmus OF4]MDV2884379.1 hypothetical protein [Alkalihalophilus pseudofirmus]MEC2070868.1 hypothetical protein [Alkalihalophilus marmarensis]WEG18394.1 hypothetical protein PQ478_07905 [Alkalihalophilus pseudofirmus]